MTGFVKGFSHFFQAFSVVNRCRLWHIYLYPVMLSVALFCLSLYAGAALSEALTGKICHWLHIDATGGEQDVWDMLVSWLFHAARFGVALVIRLSVWLIWLRLNKYIVLILLSPLFAWLSERVESELTGRSYPFSITQLLHDALRGSLLALRNFFIELLIIIFFAVLEWFMPFMAIIAIPFLMAVSAYFYGFSMMDYTSERRRLSISASVAYIRANKGMALGNGFAYLLTDSIPLLGLVIAPVNAAVGATTAILESEGLIRESISNSKL